MICLCFWLLDMIGPGHWLWVCEHMRELLILMPGTATLIFSFGSFATKGLMFAFYIFKLKKNHNFQAQNAKSIVKFSDDFSL